jgi:hypothetical protein
MLCCIPCCISRPSCQRHPLLVCVLCASCVHPVCILCASCVHPVCILCASLCTRCESPQVAGTMAFQVLLHSVFLALVCLFGMRDLQRMDAATMVLSRSNSVDEPEPGRAPYRDSPKSRPSSPCVYNTLPLFIDRVLLMGLGGDWRGQGRQTCTRYFFFDCLKVFPGLLCKCPCFPPCVLSSPALLASPPMCCLPCAAGCPSTAPSRRQSAVGGLQHPPVPPHLHPAGCTRRKPTRSLRAARPLAPHSCPRPSTHPRTCR